MHGGFSTRTARVIGVALVAGSVVASALSWSSLPDAMAIHWDAGGTADRTASKPVGALLLPALAAGLLVLLEALPRIDSLGDNVAAFRETYDLFMVSVVALLVAIHGVVLAANLGYEVDVTAITLVFVGGLLLVSSVVLKRAKPNWFVRIRTPWTLSSPDVWERTHELGATLFALAGVASLAIGIAGFVVDLGETAIHVFVAIVLATALVPVAYSWYLYEALDGPGDDPRVG